MVMGNNKLVTTKNSDKVLAIFIDHEKLTQ